MNIFGLNISIGRSKETVTAAPTPTPPAANEPAKGNNVASKKGNSGGSSRAYTAGQPGGKRFTGMPTYNASSINREIGRGNDFIAERARFLYQNNGTSKQMINSISNHTTGSGISPNFTGEDVQLCSLLKKMWDEWTRSTNIDWDGKQNFLGLQNLVSKTHEREGEVFIVRRVVPRKENKYALQLQVLDRKFLATFKTSDLDADGGKTYRGIKTDKRGKVKGYWMYTHHPSEMYSEPVFMSTDEVIHVHNVDFPGQKGGVSALAPVMLNIADLDEYNDADLMRVKMNAAFAMFIRENSDEGDTSDAEGVEDGEMIQPGTMMKLRPGEDVTPSNPPIAPGAENFRKSINQVIASGVGTTYEIATGDYSNVNFSSGRMGWIEMSKRVYAAQHYVLIPQFFEKVLEWFFDMLPLIPGSGITSTTVMPMHTWTTPRREMLDPVKETNSIILQLKNSMISWSEVAQMFGKTPEELANQIKNDIEMFQKWGLKSPWAQVLDMTMEVKGKNNNSVG